MPASYPTSIITLATHSDGDTVFAADVNTPNAEIVAVETGLLNGFQHNLSPLTDNSKDLGDATHAWKNLWTKGTTQFNGVAYTWPAADGASGQLLQTNGSKVLSWAAGVLLILNEFRLSLTTALSVTTADVTAATTLYLTPHSGRRMSVFDGSGNVTILTSAEISIAVPATTSTMYDVFVYSNSGVLALELLAWTNDTTRATAIIKTGAIDAAGVWTKTGDPTRRYVGSFRTTTVSGQTEDSVLKRYVFNNANRVRRALIVTDTTATWAGSGTIFRQVRGNAANQVDVVVGVAEVEVSLRAGLLANNGTTGNTAFATSIGFDSTSASAAGTFVVSNYIQTASGSVLIPLTASLEHFPTVGRHLYQWLERQGDATPANTTFFGNHTATSGGQSGMVGFIDG